MEKFQLNFVVCGFQKSGTSALADFLARQVEINFCTTKEPSFFIKENYKPELTAYYNLFKANNKLGLFGEASTAYGFLNNSKFSASKLYDHNPEMKILFVIRNPVKRVLSNLRHGQFNRSGRVTEEWYLKRFESSIENSRYFEIISNYRRYFKDSQIKIITLEEISEPSGLNEILSFLGLNEQIFPELRKVNDTSNKKVHPIWMKFYKRNHGVFLTFFSNAKLRKSVKKFMFLTLRKNTSKVQLLELREGDEEVIKNKLIIDNKNFKELYNIDYFSLSK